MLPPASGTPLSSTPVLKNSGQGPGEQGASPPAPSAPAAPPVVAASPPAPPVVAASPATPPSPPLPAALLPAAPAPPVVVLLPPLPLVTAVSPPAGSPPPSPSCACLDVEPLQAATSPIVNANSPLAVERVLTVASSETIRPISSGAHAL